MLSLRIFFVGLLVCGTLAVEGSSRSLRLSARRSAGEARTIAPSTVSQASTTSASARRTVEIEEVPELEPRRAASLVRSREGANLSSLLSRGNVDSVPKTRNAPGNRGIFLSEDSTRSIKSRSIDEKNVVTGLRKSKPNATFTPELNALDALDKKRKLISRSEKIRREPTKHFGRFRTRRVTKELREFWERLDQRELTTQIDKRKDPVQNNAGNSNSDLTVFKNPPGTNETEVNDAVFEEFPFLSENYDYNYYYYEDEEMHSNTSSTASPSNHGNITEKATSLPKELLVQEQSMTHSESRSDSSFQGSTSSVNDATTMSQSRDSLSKKLSDNMLLVPKIQARRMPELTAQGSRRVAQFTAVPIAIPVTASDSFRNRRQNDNERDANRPRDILKEFPIFRQLNKNQTIEETKRKTLSLHERLLHLTSRQSLDDSNTSIPITTEIIATTTETSTSTLTASAIQSTTPLSTTTTTGHIELITMSQELPKTSPVHRKTLEIRLLDTEQVTNFTTQKQTDVTLKNSSDSSSNSTQQIQRNVTFSTSKTHKIAQTSPSFTIDTPLVFESQLGIAPLGETPFGIAPFGEIPMGEKPFGLLPQGIAPLGNSTSEEMNATDTDATGAEGVDGRYHVQVTAPDGSINGDYIVVDPVTGDVNGVRYEAAHDVDPLLVQRALLNFLSLDPRLSPAGTSTANDEEILNDGTNPPDTTEVDVVLDVDIVTVTEQLEKTSQSDIELETGPSEIIESAPVESPPAQSDSLITEMPESMVTPEAPIAEPTAPPEISLVLTE